MQSWLVTSRVCIVRQQIFIACQPFSSKWEALDNNAYHLDRTMGMMIGYKRQNIRVRILSFRYNEVVNQAIQADRPSTKNLPAR